MAEETVEELEKKEGEPVAEGEADSNEEKEEEKKEEKEEEKNSHLKKKSPNLSVNVRVSKMCPVGAGLDAYFCRYGYLANGFFRDDFVLCRNECSEI